MKHGSTLFLKIAVFLIGTPVFILTIVGLFSLIRNPASPEYAYILYPIVTGMFLTTIPFYFALYQALKLLGYIDKNEAFSQFSVEALKKIKVCALTISGVYVVIMPFIFLLADKDDAPGAIIIGGVPIFASIVIAVFAAVLQRLLQVAIDIKSENDLTV
ncbi:DUF2975 domain-containing protein [Sutcliffiella horikoshii]|uniref:DUF2975 domain-containing protein n=1 Tax=Sutcliffiella horikoshii TaxID=79883 RepID=A0A1Y0CIQ9_9BACI|nr:DUF2975 domain-containing protein [Sutcliffiella horikoshii]ART75062.1 hypothetical protein B4U37_02930 [Sutcliffiella horikoshii]TYS58466.1 DUF2975 domain-containing protein [Sutcliffiella horikoshii]